MHGAARAAVVNPPQKKVRGMSQIQELEGRITAAMARISVGLGALAQQAGAREMAGSALSQALNEEKLANAQLEERLRHLKEKHAEEIAALQFQLEAAEAQEPSDTEIAALKAEIEALKARLADTADLDSLSAESERMAADLERARSEAEVLREELVELQAGPGDSGAEADLRAQVAVLQAELTEARAVVPVASVETAGDLDALQTELAHQAEQAARLDMEMQRLRATNDQLRETSAALRAVNEAGVGEPSLINRAMLAELEALRATRAVEAAEAGAILSRLEPLLASARNPSEGEDE